MNNLPFKCNKEGCRLQFSTRALFLIHLSDHTARGGPQVPGPASEAIHDSIARPSSSGDAVSMTNSTPARVKISGSGSILDNNGENRAKKRPRLSGESTTKEYHTIPGNDLGELAQKKVKTSELQGTPRSLDSTINNRIPIKPAPQSATKTLGHPPVIIVLSDTEDDTKDANESRNAKLAEKVVALDHKESLLNTNVRRSTVVLEGFSRKRSGWGSRRMRGGFSRKRAGGKGPKIDLEPGTCCQWHQHLRKREEEQQGSLWKNVITPTCHAAFRNPRNLVDHYLTHLRELHGTIECPIAECGMILRSSKGLKGHNRLFHERATVKRRTLRSPSTSSSSATLVAATISGSSMADGAAFVQDTHGLSSVSNSKQMPTQPSTAPSTQINTAPSTRIAVSDINEFTPKQNLQPWSDPRCNVYTISDLSSSSSPENLGDSNNKANDNNNGSDTDRTETDDEYMCVDDIVNGAKEGNTLESTTSSIVSDYEVNSLPRVLGPFFTRLQKK
ncbi:hypothetical protein EMPS_01192 [Entomortierella parvispora]|uniref:C2H2-type domain-containing protein n=1 Tax=Entomortierella parvispora TaxID=205924 RepID=A0A9P3LSB4_9FUNG|nr:hypothetical protein EMPS_01192 [Entomortierella parvispora]